MAAGCADDNRPIGPLEPDAGEANGGSSAGTSQGGKGGNAQGGKSGGTNAGGTANGGKAGSTAGGTSAGEGGATSSVGGAGGEAGGVEPGAGGVPAGGADGSAGAGGDVAVSESAPFAGPYAVVYAGPSIGVDFRPATSASFVDGAMSDFVVGNNAEHRALGTASNFDVNKTAFVQWGRWADGTMGVTDQVALSATQGFDYAIGAISPSLPGSGTQDYELVGYPPVVVGDGSKPLGTLTASATAAFSATTHVGATFSLVLNDVTYTVTTAGGTATPGTSEVTTSSPTYPGFVSGIPADPATGICADGCTVSIMGYFAGPNAENLAFVVHVYDTFGGSPTSVTGVVVLKKKT
jgi:hypothetical protein